MEKFWRRVLRIWEVVSHGHTFFEIVILVITGKAALGAALGAIAGFVAILSSLSPVLIVFSIAGGFALGLFVSNELTSRRIQKRLQRLQEAEDTAQTVAAPSGSFPFDSYAITSYLAQVDLTGLSEPDSFMMITLNVRNASGYPVTITGVKGRIRCAGSECNPVATVEQEPRQLRTSARDRVPCTIRQPISGDMMQVVAQEALAGNLVISLSGLQWVGSVALPQDSVPLEGCYIQEDFVVKGPFREKRHAGTLFRLRTTFLSSEHYNSDGTPKQNG